MTQYLHPSVDVKIVDNSFVYVTGDGTTALFQVIRSSKGPDSKLTKVTTPTEFLYLFGKPNLQKYGQASYNVLSWLQSGGVAYVIRVIPTDATYSGVGLGMAIGKAADEGAGATYTPVTFTGIKGTSTSAISTALRTTLSSYDGASNDAIIPMGFVHPFGRGTGYDDLGIRIVLRDDLDDTYDFRTYDLTVTSKDSLGNDQEIEGPFLIAFDPEAMNKANQSVYWANVVNKYSDHIRIVDNRKAFDQITEYFVENNADVLATAGKDGGPFNPAGLDFITGRARGEYESDVYELLGEPLEKEALETLVVAALPDQPAAFAVYNHQGVNGFGSGSEGTWEGANEPSALTVNAYSGITDPSLLDPKFIEIDVLLDANYDPNVKDAIAKLATDGRGDCVAFLDCEVQANEAQTVEYRRNSVQVSHRNVAIFAHDMEVYDSHNGEMIHVTTPYLLASKIPSVDYEFGIQYPFVGPRRGTISGFENINFIPNPIWREEFYKNKINYIEHDPRKINLATQTTSQAQNSALSDINNMRVLLRIKREVNNMMSDYRMEFNDASTYTAANYDLNNYLATWVSNRACTYATASVFASDYDRQQRIMRVNIELQFTGIIERIAVQITVNR